jgi:hypothetical protein
MLPFDISKLPQKVHLSGADCFHIVLDKHSHKHKTGGNTMHHLFCFDENIDEEKIQQAIGRSALLYWLCNIELVHGSLKRIPYWKFSDQGRQPIISPIYHQTEGEVPDQVLQTDISLEAERFIQFHIIRYPSGKSSLVMSWNHILMDGKGTSLLIRHLDEMFEGRENAFDDFFPAKGKRPDIIGYIRNMYKVKAFIKRSAKAPIASIAGETPLQGEPFLYKTICFSKEETAQIDANAFNNGARIGANLYNFSCCLHAVHRHLKNKRSDGVLWTPIPYDGRLRGAKGPVISNAVSFVFYRVSPDKLGSLRQTVGYLSGQMAEQLKKQIPQRYTRLLNMMRHIPLSLYYYLISRTGKGAFSSFLYSTTGNNYNDFQTLFGYRVQRMTVYPCPTYPPGLTFIFTRHLHALNISFAYLPSVLDKSALDELLTDLKQLLLQADTDHNR